MEKKVSGAALGESWFLVYFYVCSKYPNFKVGKNQINAEFWVNYFRNGGKLESFLKSTGLEKLVEILGQDLKDIDNSNKFTPADAEKYFTKGDKFTSIITGKQVLKGGGWDEALKFQATRFLRNGAVKNAAKMNVLRQGQFYQLTGLNVILTELIKFYGFGGTIDRWNPADVWFYNQVAVIKIKKYLKDSKGFYDRSLRGKNKSLGIEAIIGLNDLILELYDSKDLYPVSLKKASFNKYKGRDEKNSKYGSYTFRLAAVNDPRKDVKGRPNDPKLVNKQIPIEELGTNSYIAGGGKDAGISKLSYTIEVDTVIYNQKGEKAYVREFNYLSFDENKLSARPQKRYSEAQSGSLMMTNINEITWTPEVASKLRTIRNKIQGMSQGDLVNGNGSAQIGTNQAERAKSAIEYFDLLCKEVESKIKDRKIVLAKSSKNQQEFPKSFEKMKFIQNELEVLFAIEKCKDPVEIVFDLWKASVAKGQTGRKSQFDKLVKSLQEAQKMSKEDAEKEAEKLLRANSPQTIKIPSSFHLKLY